MADQQLRLVATEAEPEDSEPEDAEMIERAAAIAQASYFGCVRWVVWALVVEAILVIAGLLCWRLHLLPR